MRRMFAALVLAGTMATAALAPSASAQTVINPPFNTGLAGCSLNGQNTSLFPGLLPNPVVSVTQCPPFFGFGGLGLGGLGFGGLGVNGLGVGGVGQISAQAFGPNGVTGTVGVNGLRCAGLGGAINPLGFGFGNPIGFGVGGLGINGVGTAGLGGISAQAFGPTGTTATNGLGCAGLGVGGLGVGGLGLGGLGLGGLGFGGGLGGLVCPAPGILC